MKQTMDPLVSVIIATRNRQLLLSQTPEALAAQDWSRERLEVRWQRRSVERSPVAPRSRRHGSRDSLYAARTE